MAEEASHTTRYDTQLSVILLDVDRFKQFDSSYGHPMGDTVLRSVASILQRYARDTDTMARYGGEEFVLMLPQTDLDGAAVFAERLRDAIENQPWPMRAITASFGVSTLQFSEQNGAELVHRADRALYLSKAAGRNCVTCMSDNAP